jgi:hydrogenase-1 operon protein HyaF
VERLSRLTDIPIRLEAPPADGGLGGGVTALLTELATLLEHFAEGEESAAIDLRSLPMGPQDRALLQRALGEGEVRATIDAEGVSTIRETRIGGVWWVEHRNGQGELIAELLEVTRVPAILASAPDEIAAGGRALRQQIAVTAAHAPLPPVRNLDVGAR